MNTKFKAFGYVWDFELPLMIIGLCIAVVWTFMPMAFNDSTPWWMFVLWFAGCMLMFVWATKRKASDE